MKKEHVKKGLSLKMVLCLVFISILAGVVIAFGLVYFLWPNILPRLLPPSPTGKQVNTVVEQRTYVEESSLTHAIEKALPSVVAVLPIEDLQQFKKSKMVLGEPECPLLGNSGFDCWKRPITGLIVTSDGVVVTLLDNLPSDLDKKQFTAIFNDHTEYDLEFIAKTEDHLVFFQLVKKGELALPLDQRTKLFDFPILAFAELNNLKVGQKLIAVAFNNLKGQLLSFPTSIAQLDLAKADYWGIRDTDRAFSSLQVNSTVTSIFTGSPIVNLEGQVIGLSRLIVAENHLLQKVITNDDIYEALGNLNPKEISKKATFGFKYLILDKNFAQKFALEIQYGAYIIAGYSDDMKNLDLNSIQEGSNGQKIGLKPKDIILEIDGKLINSFDSLERSLSLKKVGEKIKFKVFRNQAEIELEGVLE